MTEPRKPAAFRLDPEQSRPSPAREQPAAPAQAKRAPRALRAEDAVVVPAEIDVFAEPTVSETSPPPATPAKGRSWLGTIFASAFGILVSLALGLWADRVVRDLFSRADWLGWVAMAAAIIAVAAFILILLRELLALTRLSSMQKLRAAAADAVVRDDSRAARRIVDELTTLVAWNPQTAAGRRALAELSGDIIDGADLIRLAETEILAPLDARAKMLVLDAAKRVSVVTAISPRAVVDLAYVVFEAGRLIRRLSELYGGRPGTLGFLMLARRVLAHLAVTGVIAAGDEVVHQLVGQGLAARISARLGEGVVNGTMTARIGIAAIETVRPLPFIALKRPKLADFLSALASFTRSRATERSSSTK